MKSKSSKNFIAEVTDRVLKLQRATNETGLDLTSDLIKTLNQLSEVSRDSPVSDFSSEFLSIDESGEILQPTNSLLSISQSDPDLISNIKKTNSELRKHCSEKLIELRCTTKEFCSKNQNLSKKDSLIIEETTAEKTIEGRVRAKTLPDYPEKPLELIYNELSKIKSDLELANKKLIESQTEIIRQKSENYELKDKINSFLESNQKSTLRPMCECRLF